MERLEEAGLGYIFGLIMDVNVLAGLLVVVNWESLM